MRLRVYSPTFVCALIASTCLTGYGQSATPDTAPPVAVQPAPASTAKSVTQAVDESNLITLSGNTRPEATSTNDRGPVSSDFPLEHMLLQLQPSPARQEALDAFVSRLHDPVSADYHHWINADEYGRRFGLAQDDMDTITYWLESHGFTVSAYPNRLLIDFSGTAGQVRDAFHTEIHSLDVNGTPHIANMSDPKIPASLAPAIIGIVSLHDFRPHSMYRRPTANYTFPSSSRGTYYGVVPGDMEKIYNLDSAFAAGYTGKGQTIVLLEDTDLYAASDWTTFRKVFGLANYTFGSLTTIHPAPKSGTNNCADPGVNGADPEAALDVEWASAAAPNAAIVLASCADMPPTFGGLIALENLINGSGKPPAIVSISYGESETINGVAGNAAFKNAYEQATAEGVSVFVAAGDEGAALNDPDAYFAVHGINVNAFASTPYNVAVGGTDFGDKYAGTQSTYWNADNSSTYESAKSYIPEIPWNDTCGSVLLMNYYAYGSTITTTYGLDGFCQSNVGSNFLDTIAGSGGPSGCATGTTSSPYSGVVSGTCKGWPKPSWQSVLGNPYDKVRDLPDVSLFAGNGVWNHLYFFCDSDPNYSYYPCTAPPDYWLAGGGTSFAAPIWAGFQALVNEKTGKRWGNPNPVYYQLARAEYGTLGEPACNSTLGTDAASTCTFYDVTLGDNDLVCSLDLVNLVLTPYDCLMSNAPYYGVLSLSNDAYEPAYPATTGWDFATGIGTVNVNNLLKNWPTPTK